MLLLFDRVLCNVVCNEHFEVIIWGTETFLDHSRDCGLQMLRLVWKPFWACSYDNRDGSLDRSGLQRYRCQEVVCCDVGSCIWVADSLLKGDFRSSLVGLSGLWLLNWSLVCNDISLLCEEGANLAFG